jgi:hypothetical protein
LKVQLTSQLEGAIASQRQPQRRQAVAMAESSASATESSSVKSEHTPHKAATNGSRNADEYEWTHEHLDPDQMSPDYAALLSLVIGIVSIAFQARRMSK